MCMCYVSCLCLCIYDVLFRFGAVYLFFVWTMKKQKGQIIYCIYFNLILLLHSFVRVSAKNSPSTAIRSADDSIEPLEVVHVHIVCLSLIRFLEHLIHSTYICTPHIHIVNRTVNWKTKQNSSTEKNRFRQLVRQSNFRPQKKTFPKKKFN